MYKIYEVKTGDTLESIAKDTGTTVDELRRINGFTPVSTLKVGQKIIVPDNNEQLFQFYVVQPGDNMYAIAKKFNADYQSLLKLNGLEEDDYIYPEEEILVPKDHVAFFITTEGDTTNSIAEDLGVNLVQLLLQNENIYLRPDQLIAVKKEQI